MNMVHAILELFKIDINRVQVAKLRRRDALGGSQVHIVASLSSPLEEPSHPSGGLIDDRVRR